MSLRGYDARRVVMHPSRVDTPACAVRHRRLHIRKVYVNRHLARIEQRRHLRERGQGDARAVAASKAALLAGLEGGAGKAAEAATAAEKASEGKGRGPQPQRGWDVLQDDLLLGTRSLMSACPNRT